MIVIGLTGYKGAGKDSVADILVEDYGFTKMSFATPLKRMLRRLDPIIGHDLYAGCCNECSDTPEVTEVRMSDALKFGFDDQSLKHSPWGEEVRDLWERFGTEVIREVDPHFWVRQASAELGEKMIGVSDRVVFTDVRFENEADMIRDFPDIWTGSHKSVLWRIARPGQEPGDHVSDQMAGLLGERITIINDGEIGDLEPAIAEAWDLTILAENTPTQMELDLDWWKEA